MNKDHILFHLNEAIEQLSETISQLRTDTEITEGEYYVAMQHAYHHLNTAWNARGIASVRIENATDEDFNDWGSFPVDIDLMTV